MNIPLSTRPAALHKTKDGARQRAMMALMYAISFQCLLRFDEVHRIATRHLRVYHLAEGPKIELTLDFRKTHQTGGKTSEL
jgi:hypothetical protein